jgi:hypothetical protein
MRIALVNPSWRFDGGIYYGCRGPHLSLELGARQALLQRAGHASQIFDDHLLDLEARALADEVAAFRPDITVLTTAPTYLLALRPAGAADPARVCRRARWPWRHRSRGGSAWIGDATDDARQTWRRSRRARQM